MMNRHEHHHHPPSLPSDRSGGGGGGGMLGDGTMGGGGNDNGNGDGRPYHHPHHHSHPGMLKPGGEGGGAYLPTSNYYYDKHKTLGSSSSSSIPPSHYGHHHHHNHNHHFHPPPPAPPMVVESRHPPSTSSRVQQQHPSHAFENEYGARHPPPPPHPADKFGKTITVSSRTTIQEDDDDNSNSNDNNYNDDDGGDISEAPSSAATTTTSTTMTASRAAAAAAAAARFTPTKRKGNSAFQPYYRPPPPKRASSAAAALASQQPHLLQANKIIAVDKTRLMEEEVEVEEDNGDDTSDDRASDDEIKAANSSILLLDEYLESRQDDDENDHDDHDDDGYHDDDKDGDTRMDPTTTSSMLERQVERKEAMEQHSSTTARPESRDINSVMEASNNDAPSSAFHGGSSEMKKNPLAIATTSSSTSQAVSSTALKRPRDEDDAHHQYEEYSFGVNGGGGGGGVDDQTPKHINFRRHPPSFFSSHATNSSPYQPTNNDRHHHYHHPSNNDRHDDRHHLGNDGGEGYGYHHGSYNPSSMEEEKEDRQDRSTQHHHHHHYATTTSSEASGSGREEVATTAAAVPGGEEEEEGGIQSHWLTSSNDDTNDIHALKNATSQEYGGVSGGNSIIGSSSYLNFSRSLSWEIPTNGTLSNIGKSTSFSTPHHPHSLQNDQHQHLESEGIVANESVRKEDIDDDDDDAKAVVDFPPLQSMGSGSLPPRKRHVSLAPRPTADTMATATTMDVEVGAGHRGEQQQPPRRSYEPPATVHHPHGGSHRRQPQQQHQQHSSVPLRQQQQDHPQNHHHPASHVAQVTSYDQHYHHSYPPPPQHHNHHTHPSHPQHHPPHQQRYHHDSRFEPPHRDYHVRSGEGYNGMDHHSRGGGALNERGGHNPYEGTTTTRYNHLPANEYSANNGPRGGAHWEKPPHHAPSSNYAHHHDTRGGGDNDLDGENNYTSDSRSFDSSSLSRKSFRSLDDLEEPMQNLLYRPSFSWERGLDVPYPPSSSSGNNNGSGGDGTDGPSPLPPLQIGVGGGRGGDTSTSNNNNMIQLSGQQKIMKALAMRSEIRTIGNPNGPMGVILLLAMPQDRHCLSETLCIVRNNVEVFTATEVDINAPAPGRKRPIQVGQVGLRCVYCRMCPQRDRVKRATCFPSSMKRIYRAVIDMKLDHFKNCPYVPSGLKGRLDQLQTGSTRSTGMTVQYFVKSAKELGMLDNADDGVCIDLRRVGSSSSVGVQESKYSAYSSPLPPPPLPPPLPPLPAMSMGGNAVVPYNARPRDGGHAHQFPPSHDKKQKKAQRQQQKQSRQHEYQHPPYVTLPTTSHNDVSCRTSPFESREETTTSNTFEHQFPETRFSGKVLLTVPDDENFLSPLRCFLRMNVCAFTASAHDIAVRTPTTFAVRVGQVGVGCVHCLAVPPKSRSNRAVCFPFAMSRIYQSVADIQRFHLGECRMMPPNIRAEFLKLQSESAKGSRGLATRTYWIDSAKKIGLADGPTGMYFCRDPSLPLLTEGDATVEKMDSESHDAICNELVAPEDKPTIADFLYVVMEQLRPCRFTDADRNKRRSKNVGCVGVECKHCAGKIDGRKFFWSSVSAAESNFVSVHSHMLTCKYIPESLKAELTQLKALRREQTSRLKNGSQKAFFMRVWARLHGMPVLPPSSAVDAKKPETGSKSKSSTSKNTHVLNFDAKGSNEFDAHDIRALLESKSTLSSMPSVDESITKHATQDSEALDLDIRKSDSDLNLRANQSEASADNIAITESKSSLSSMALNMSTFSVYCKEEEEGSGSSQIV